MASLHSLKGSVILEALVSLFVMSLCLPLLFSFALQFSSFSGHIIERNLAESELSIIATRLQLELTDADIFIENDYLFSFENTHTSSAYRLDQQRLKLNQAPFHYLSWTAKFNSVSQGDLDSCLVLDIENSADLRLCSVDI
jgi:hypothetical protein